MRRIKSIILFIIIFLIIVMLDFYLYKNLDKLIPKHDGDLYIFENNVKKKNKEFIEEIYEHVEITNNKKVSKEELDRIKLNETLYNILKNYVYKIDSFYEKMGQINTKELEKIFEEVLMEELYTGKLTNTIYGDLNVIMIISNGENKYYLNDNNDCIILYSDDMSKVYYLDVNKKIVYEDVIDDNYKMIYYDEKGEEKELFSGLSRDEILNKVNRIFSKVFVKKEFKPDTIIYKESYYILKDTTENITLYYDKQENIIFGLHIGFQEE